MRALRRWGRKRKGLTQRTQSSQRKAEEADPSAARPDAPKGGAEEESRAVPVGMTRLGGAQKAARKKSRVPLRGIGDCRDPSAAARKTARASGRDDSVW